MPAGRQDTSGSTILPHCGHSGNTARRASARSCERRREQRRVSRGIGAARPPGRCPILVDRGTVLRLSGPRPARGIRDIDVNMAAAVEARVNPGAIRRPGRGPLAGIFGRMRSLTVATGVRQIGRIAPGGADKPPPEGQPIRRGRCISPGCRGDSSTGTALPMRQALHRNPWYRLRASRLAVFPLRNASRDRLGSKRWT